VALLGTNVRAVHRGRLVASLLQGAWRGAPGAASLRHDELDLILPMLVRSGTAALAWRRIRNTPLASSPPGERLRTARRIQAAEAAIRAGQIERVLSVDGMQEADPILVKGWANGRFYAEDGLRHYTDIDLIVRPNRYEAAVRAAVTSVPADPDQDIPVDIQPILKDLPDRSWQQIYDRSHFESVQGCQVSVLGAEDTIRLACLHLLRHLGFQPLWLCDVAALVENLPADFDWNYCLSGERRRTKWMLAVIRLANQLLGANLDRCPAALIPRAVPRWVVTTILARWGTEASFQYPWPRPRRILRVMRTDPRRLPDAIASHWPDPLQAVDRLGWPINNVSGRTAQIVYFTARPFYRSVRHGLLRSK